MPTAIIGKKISDVLAIEWVKNWVAVGQVRIVDFNNDGVLQLSEWFMNEDVVVLATPEIAGLPYVISGLVAAAEPEEEQNRRIAPRGARSGPWLS